MLEGTTEVIKFTSGIDGRGQKEGEDPWFRIRIGIFEIESTAAYPKGASQLGVWRWMAQGRRVVVST